MRVAAPTKAANAKGPASSLSAGSGLLQRELVVGASNDPLELEADQVADHVTAAPAHAVVGGTPPRIQRFSGQPSGQVEAAPPSVDHVLASPGRPLEPALRQDMGQRFGHDFSRVRVHADAAAGRSAQDVGANAYTVGHDIVFGAGRFAPGTHVGRRLIAHELTHVVQQSGAEGTRAAPGLLARDPKAKTPPVKKPPSEPSGFHGDGKHGATDARYAAELGKADGARLEAAGAKADEVHAEINQKLAWFQAQAHAAYLAEVTPAFTKLDLQREQRRTDLTHDISRSLDAIQKLKHDRIEAWEKTARLPEANWGLAVLEIAIAIVSEGFGGIAYGIIEKMLEKKAASHLVKEFVMLAGLEAGDLLAEKTFKETLSLLRTDFEVGRKASEKHITESAKVALATTKGDTLAAYVESMKLQTIQEQKDLDTAFTARSKDEGELRMKAAALELTYKQLKDAPDAYLQALTVGYLRLEDEATLAEKAKDHGGDRQRTFEEDRGAHSLGFRAGNVNITADPYDYSLEHWNAPRLGFSGVKASASGANEESLEYLKGVAIKDLPVTTVFEFRVYGAYQPVFGTQYDTVAFVRDPSGRFYVPDSTSGMEAWLSWHYVGDNGDVATDQKKFFAPFGARKLYEAIKDKPITATSHERPFGDQ